MKTILKIIFIFILFIKIASAQDDKINTLSITPVFFEQSEEISIDVQNLIKNKIRQIASKYGFASNYKNDRHIMYADVQMLNKNVVHSAPPKVYMDIEITFYVADYDTKIIYGNFIKTAQGAGNNETKAYFNALKSININDRGFETLMTESKKKILAYYNAQCDLIIEQANSLASQKKYEEAIALLTRIPKECEECFYKSTDVISKIFSEYEKNQCRIYLAKSTSTWTAEQNEIGAHKTEPYLAKITKGSDCYFDAQKLIDIITKTLKEKENKVWEFKLKELETEKEIVEYRYKALTEIAKSYHENQPPSQYIQIIK